MSSDAHYAWSAAPKRQALGSGVQSFWLVFDLALAMGAILAATDAVNRFGVASPLWALVYAMTVVRLALQPDATVALFRRNIVLFFYPAVCGASVIWSVGRTFSLVSAVQLTMTVIIAIAIGARFRIRTLILLIFLVVAFTDFLSLVNWQTGIFGEVWAGSGGLLGIYPQKNALGQKCHIAILAGFALLLLPGKPDRLFQAIVIVTIAMMMLALHLSKSVTAIILLAPALGLFFLMCWRRLNQSVVVFSLIFGIVVAGVMPLALAMMDLNAIDLILGYFGKSRSLTGRTDLWDIAERVLQNHYLLGVGYLSFWRSPEFAAEALLAQEIGGESVRGFHNFVLEIWIGTGLPGLLAMGVMLWLGLSRTLRLYVATKDPAVAFAAVVVITSIALSLFGTNLYRQHEFFIMLVVMMAVAAGDQTRRLQSSRRAGFQT